MNENRIPFTKMHGAGNDFIVIDARGEDFPLKEIRKKIPLLCDRRTGIGADGILMLGHSELQDYTMHFLNPDASEAGMCGNGARCLAMFAHTRGFSSRLTFQIHDAVYRAEVHDDYVSLFFPVNPQPEVTSAEEESSWYKIHTGTEHIVSIDSDYCNLSDSFFKETGRRLRNRNDLFPTGTNVNFCWPVNQNRIVLVTYERGVEDLTKSCGTGAIAAAILWDYQKHENEKLPEEITQIAKSTEHHIQVDCPGGPLEVSFEAHRKQKMRTYQNIRLHGPAIFVFEGYIPF